MYCTCTYIQGLSTNHCSMHTSPLYVAPQWYLSSIGTVTGLSSSVYLQIPSMTHHNDHWFPLIALHHHAQHLYANSLAIHTRSTYYAIKLHRTTEIPFLLPVNISNLIVCQLQKSSQSYWLPTLLQREPLYYYQVILGSNS